MRFCIGLNLHYFYPFFNGRMKKKKKQKAKTTTKAAMPKNHRQKLKTFAKMGFGLLTFLLSVYWLYPSISIRPQQVRIATDPFRSLFVLTNENIYSISDVRCDYFIDSSYISLGNNGAGFGMRMNSLDSSSSIPLYFSISKLEGKKEHYFNIQHFISGGLSFAQMRIVVVYHVLGIALSDTFHYTTFKNYAGVFEWIPSN